MTSTVCQGKIINYVLCKTNFVQKITRFTFEPELIIIDLLS